MTENSTVSIDIETPNHEYELTRAIELLKKVEDEIKWFKEKSTPIPYENRKKLHHVTISVLDIVGELSISMFELRDTLESLYFKQYRSQPALAKTLWLDHYEKLHEPYDKLKKKCRILLYIIDPKNQFISELI